jgi:hypothetical protein
MQKEGVESGFRAVLTRPPSERETLRLQQLWGETRDDYQNDPAAAADLAQSAGLPAKDADPELAAWITVANVLLNLDETVTKP